MYRLFLAATFESSNGFWIYQSNVRRGNNHSIKVIPSMGEWYFSVKHAYFITHHTWRVAGGGWRVAGVTRLQYLFSCLYAGTWSLKKLNGAPPSTLQTKFYHCWIKLIFVRTCNRNGQNSCRSITHVLSGSVLVVSSQLVSLSRHPRGGSDASPGQTKLRQYFLSHLWSWRATNSTDLQKQGLNRGKFVLCLWTVKIESTMAAGNDEEWCSGWGHWQVRLALLLALPVLLTGAYGTNYVFLAAPTPFR